MKKFILFSVAATLISSISFATIRRVGFFGTPVANVDYTTFATAYTAAASGDTILVFPGPSVSGTITKKLIIIGTGYWLDPTSTPKGNANMQAFTSNSTASTIYFQSGSAGSVVMGFDFNGSGVYVAESNITVMRNREVTVTTAYTSPAATTTNLQVLQNYRVIVNYYYGNGSSVTNMNVSNNLINYISLGTANSYSGAISNNDFAYDATSTSLNGGSTTLSGTSTTKL